MQWFIKLVNPEISAYTITLQTSGTFEGNWFPKGGEPTPEDPINTSEKTYEWLIEPDRAPGVPEGAVTYVSVIYQHLLVTCLTINSSAFEHLIPLSA